MIRVRMPREHVVALAIAVLIVGLIVVSAHALKPRAPTLVSSPQPTSPEVLQLHDSTDVVQPNE